MMRRAAIMRDKVLDELIRGTRTNHEEVMTNHNESMEKIDKNHREAMAKHEESMAAFHELIRRTSRAEE